MWSSTQNIRTRPDTNKNVIKKPKCVSLHPWTTVIHLSVTPCLHCLYVSLSVTPCLHCLYVSLSVTPCLHCPYVSLSVTLPNAVSMSLSSSLPLLVSPPCIDFWRRHTCHQQTLTLGSIAVVSSCPRITRVYRYLYITVYIAIYRELYR